MFIPRTPSPERGACRRRAPSTGAERALESQAAVTGGSAPGQGGRMSTDAARVTGRTALLAILADPVEQARTPGLVNAALARRGCDAVLVPLHVAAAGLPSVLAGLRATRNFRGCVVSMPHKVAATRYVDRLTACAGGGRVQPDPPHARRAAH